MTKTRDEGSEIDPTDPDAMLDPDAVSRVFPLKKSWLAARRLDGTFCAYSKVGRKILYRRGDIDDALAQSRRTSTSDTGETPEAR
jgi:hypothetical protein